MIREKLIEKNIGANSKFRWRSHEASRIEGLSDAVFGFAVTLLIVSLEVPKTFTELMGTMRGFGAFAISFALLIVVWYTQYKFFRRYALQDNFTVVINAALLFVVLFYVYPLKFVFTFLINIFTGQKGEVHLPNGAKILMIENSDQVAMMMVIFGYMAVFGIFVLLYWHAYRKRDQLELNDLEVFDTRTDIRESALNVAIAAVSVLFGLARYASLAGMTYMLIPGVMMAHGIMSGRKRRRWKSVWAFTRIRCWRKVEGNQ